MNLKTALTSRRILFDGAMGTELKKHNPTAADYPDNHLEFNDGLCLTHPEWVQSVYEQYLAAGADCLTTNTFGSNQIKLAEYGMQADTQRVNRNAVRLAREVADTHTDKYVIGCMGPTGHLPSIQNKPEEEIALDVLEDAFYQQAVGLLSGGEGADGIVIETTVDILELKIAIRAVRRVSADIPIFANITLAQGGRMLLGTSVDAAYVTVSQMGIDVFGINCSTGPAEMEDAIRWLDENARTPILVVPNAGIPDTDNGKFPLQPVPMAATMSGLLTKYEKIRVIGGCCGTTPEHIRRLREIC